MRRVARSAGFMLLAGLLACGTALAGLPLHEAAAAGDVAEIDRLVAAGEDVDKLRFKNWSPLYVAAKKGRLEAVRHLVEVHGAAIDHGYGPASYPLYVAATNGHRDVAEYLVRRGADVEAVQYYGKGKKREAYTAKKQQPGWPWDRWVAERQAEIDRADEARQAVLDEQRARAELEAEQARLAKLRARWERDARLPLDVRRDKYVLALEKHMAEGDHESALIYFDFLRRLDVPLGPEFDLYHGQILLETGEIDAGLDRLYALVQDVPASDPNYMRALELINAAEGR